MNMIHDCNALSINESWVKCSHESKNIGRHSYSEIISLPVFCIILGVWQGESTKKIAKRNKGGKVRDNFTF